ncbi:MAG: hypothetical protein Q9192_008221, partial [Flavoplaca navasiana]
EAKCRKKFGDLPRIEVALLGDNWAVGSCLHSGLDYEMQGLVDSDRSYDFRLLTLVDQCRVLGLLSHVPICCHLVLERRCWNARSLDKRPVAGVEEVEEEMRMSLCSFHAPLGCLPAVVLPTIDFRVRDRV